MPVAHRNHCEVEDEPKTWAVTCVIIDYEDGQGNRWSTVCVIANIVDASFEAFLDGIHWKTLRDKSINK